MALAGQRILSPLRLPVPPPERGGDPATLAGAGAEVAARGNPRLRPEERFTLFGSGFQTTHLKRQGETHVGTRSCAGGVSPVTVQFPSTILEWKPVNIAIPMAHPMSTPQRRPAATRSGSRG